jgi:amino acid transporter
MVSLTYTVATLAMVFTAYSYSQMSKVYPMAGSAYTYTQRSLNPYIGFLSGWAILMDYLLLPMINYLLAAIFLTPYFPGVPSWVWVLGYIIVVTFINYNGITITAWANNALIIVQFIFIFAFVLFLAKWIAAGGGAGTFFDWNAFLNPVEFSKPEMGWGIILSGASILALSFLGFDAVTTVSEEAINPEKNVGIAIMVTCIGAGIMFIVVSYLMQLSWPTAWNEFQIVDSGAQELIVKVAGSVMGYLFTATYCIGCLACAMSSHSSAARILFGMGRDGALPKKFFGYVHPKHQTPTNNVILVGAISLSALFLSLAAACSLINFGALAGFTLVNLSVIAHYFIKHKQRGGLGVIRYLIVPLIGAAICFTIWLNLDVNSKILGFSWLVVGIIYLGATTRGFKKLPPEMKLSE